MKTFAFETRRRALTGPTFAAAAALLATAPALGQSKIWAVSDMPPYAYSLATYTLLDADRNADGGGYGGQFGVGVPIFEWLSAEASFSRTGFDDDTGADSSQTGWSLDVIAQFGERERATPYVVFGGGQIDNDVEPDLFDDTTPYVNLGAGVVGHTGVRWLRYRAEARLIHDLYLNDRQDFRIGLGAEVALSRFRERPMPPQIVETVKVVEAPAQPPSDQDGDGIVDAFDRCPDTIKGAQVDGYGCVVKAQTIELQNVTFQFNSSELTENGKSVLEPAVRFLVSQPTVRADVAGHTDSVGSDAYNKKLSLRRADSVRAFLISRGVAPGQLTSVGFGESRPIDSNATDAGRTRNRRVELQIRGSAGP